MKKNMKKALAIAGIALAAIGMGSVGAVSHSLFSEPKIQIQEKLINASAEQLAFAYADGVASVDMPVTSVEYVDNENLELVLDELYDNNGDVEYLIDDLDEDEVDQIVDRIFFANEIKSLALAEVENNLYDELDHEEIVLNDNSTYEFDEDDFEKLRLDDEADEITLSNVDYDDGDAEVLVTGRFRHDDKWFSFEAEVEFEDGQVEDFNIVSVEE